VPAQLERRPVQVLSIGQRRAVQTSLQLAADQRGDQDETAIFRQSPRVLRYDRYAFAQPADRLGGLVRVGNRDHAGRRRRVIRHQQQAFALHAADDGPADREDLVARPPPHQRRLCGGPGQFQAVEGDSPVADAQDVRQSQAVRLDGLLVRLGR